MPGLIVVIKWGDREAVPVCETVTVTGVEVCSVYKNIVAHVSAY